MEKAKKCKSNIKLGLNINSNDAKIILADSPEELTDTVRLYTGTHKIQHPHGIIIKKYVAVIIPTSFEDPP